MAVRHGLAGQYGKNEANRRSKRIIAILLASSAVGLAGLGFAYGYFLAHHGPLGALVAVVVLGCVFPLLWRPISRYIDKTARQRIRYMRGGQGEALIAWLLDDLENDWHVFNAIKLDAASDIDHVVVGREGSSASPPSRTAGCSRARLTGYAITGSLRPSHSTCCARQ